MNDFEFLFGKRPDQRSTLDLMEELDRLEREITRIRNLIVACERYDSAYEGFIAGNERGKRTKDPYTEGTKNDHYQKD